MMIRSEDKKNFTWVHNTFIRDRRLSMAERGLLLTMMSMPENWSFSVTGLYGMVADGRDRVRSTVKALEDHGYLRREQKCDENGLFNDVLYTFSDEPVFDYSALWKTSIRRRTHRCKKSSKTYNFSPENIQGVRHKIYKVSE